MNWYAVRAIYHFEMARMWRTIVQSIVAPVLSTSLYFVVFGSAIGSRIQEIDGTSYGAFIVPGLDHAVAAHGEHRQRLVRHLLPALHGHDLRGAVGAGFGGRGDFVGYVGAAATKSVILGFIILATAALFVPIEIAHPFWMLRSSC